MQVLAIIGSPRKGHSYRVVQQIEQRLMRNADLRFEYVFLNQANLQPCRGCYVCQSRGEQYCPLKDGRPDLVQKMQQADGVIFVSPTFASNVTGLMKNLMDRLAYSTHRPAFVGKPAMLVATASLEAGGGLTALAWFGKAGFALVSKLGVQVWPSPNFAWRGGRPAERKLEQAVRRFEHALTHGSPSLSLAQVLNYYTMKVAAITDPTFFAADYAFHKDMDHLGGAASKWKKVLGQLYFAIAVKLLDSRLVPTERVPGTKEAIRGSHE